MLREEQVDRTGAPGKSAMGQNPCSAIVGAVSPTQYILPGQHVEALTCLKINSCHGLSMIFCRASTRLNGVSVLRLSTRTFNRSGDYAQRR